MRGVKPGEELSTLHKVGDEVAGGVIIEIVEEVGNYHAKVQCKICGKVTKSNTQRLNSGRMCSCQKTAACSEAAKGRMQKSREEFPVGMVESGREIVGYHVSSFGKTLLMVRCVHCGKEGKVQFGDFRKKIGCPCKMYEKAGATCMERLGVVNPFLLQEVQQKCMETKAEQSEARGGASGAEDDVRDYIRSLGFETKKTVIEGRELDILIQSLNIAVEFNGVYWHCEVYRGRSYHISKTESAYRHGIDLIHIWEDLWHTRQGQVKEFLKRRLGIAEREFLASECDIKDISKELCASFVDTYHIKVTKTPADLAIGVYCEGELLAVAAFIQTQVGVVLDRFAQKAGCHCEGFLELALAGVADSADCIHAWEDRCLSDGSWLLRAGMIQVETLPPSYFYEVGGGKCRSKHSFSYEEEAAKYNKVWDCGKIHFVYNKNPAL